jgi:hypothetical protein
MPFKQPQAPIWFVTLVLALGTAFVLLAACPRTATLASTLCGITGLFLVVAAIASILGVDVAKAAASIVKDLFNVAKGVASIARDLFRRK